MLEIVASYLINSSNKKVDKIFHEKFVEFFFEIMKTVKMMLFHFLYILELKFVEVCPQYPFKSVSFYNVQNTQLTQ